MLQIIYASAATRPFSKDDLRALLTVARRNNTALGVTGMLLHDAGSFLQVLEGPPDNVMSIFGRISKDARHGRVVTLLRTSVTQRTFPEWTMGFATVDRLVMKAIPGFLDFFGTDEGLRAAQGDKAKAILQAFRDGRWRTHVDS